MTRGSREFRRSSAIVLFALPLLFAAAGFSFALATALPTSEPESPNAADRVAVESRSVGSPLRFTNPFLLAGTDPLFPAGGNTANGPNGFDLGDALQGQNIRRIISAAGGYQPYTFTLQPNLDAPRFGAATLPMLSNIGLVSGPVMAASNFLRFDVTLTDVISTHRKGVFFLKLLNAPAAFRFAQDRLPSIRQGDHFYTSLDTLGGIPPITYTIIGAVTSTSIAPTLPGTKLEDAGLELSPDGILFGRPIVNGTLSFSVQARDAMGAIATSRAGTGVSQPFALAVTANASTTSELATLGVSIKGSQAAAGKDSFSYNGILDMRGETAASLAGSPCTLRVGRSSFTGNFDAKGRVSVVLPSNQKFTVSLRSGHLSMRVTNANLAAGVGADAITTKQELGVVLGLELLSFRTSDVLRMNVTPRGGKYAMPYRLGVNGVPVTGAFQILNMRGIDAKAGSPVHLSLSDTRVKTPVLPDGDNWTLNFIAVPRVGVDGGKTAGGVFAGNTSATVRIGTTFSQQLTLTQLAVKLQFKATGADPGVFQLLLNPKNFTHRLQVNTIAATSTDIPPAITTKDLNVFPFGLDLTGFSGETGRVIVPNRSTWTQR